MHSKKKTLLGVLTWFWCDNKTGIVSWLFFKIDPYLAIKFKRSRREISIDEAKNKNRSVLKNYLKTYGSTSALLSRLKQVRSP